MPTRPVNQPIKAAKFAIFPNVEKKIGADDTKRIKDVVQEALVARTTQPYLKVQVSARYAKTGAPDSLVVYMLRAYTYTCDVAVLKVGSDYQVKSINREIDLKMVEGPFVRDRIEADISAILRKRPQLVFATPVPEIATASAAIDYLYTLGTRLGYVCVKLTGATANLANYKKYLNGHIAGFVNIGHGNTSGIVVSDGFLGSSWFSGVGAKGLAPEVVYFNSCQTFNPPVLTAINGAGRRTYVGGKVNLLIGPSEEVCKCFWTKVLKAKLPMGTSLTSCEKDKYPVIGAHGLSGAIGKFLPIPAYP